MERRQLIRGKEKEIIFYTIRVQKLKSTCVLWSKVLRAACCF